MTFNIYVPTYKRASTVMVHELVEYCTYVVRESEEQAYRDAGIENMWVVPDAEIDGFAMVQNFLIDNAPEDVIAVLDDDIFRFCYNLEDTEVITDKETATAELERWGQLLADLGLGMCGCRVVITLPYGYTGEFSLNGMVGPVRLYNRAAIKKSRYVRIPFFGDTDFVLQELVNNRIILRPNYFGGDSLIEKNEGGMNIKRTKNIQERSYAEYMKPKWGKYISFNTRKNITIIHVDR